MPDSLPHGLRPIAEAPVKQGEVYGPCLLTPGPEGYGGWGIGEWDGDGWQDFFEGSIEPTYFVFLGEPP